MQLFALDLGNRQVKLMSEKATKVLPSYFVNATEYGKRDVLALVKKEEQTTHDYISGRDSDFTYVWGTGLDVSRKRVTDTLDFNRRYDTLEFKVLADLSLAELARDFSESTTNTIDVAVVTGVPTDDYDDDETIKHIRNALIGVHSASIDGIDHFVHVRSVDVLRQTVGTAIDVMVDAVGDIKDDNDIEDGYIGVVDVGGGTIIINAFDKMNLDTKNSVQLEDGSYSLFTEIRNRIIDKGYKISEHEVEKFIRAGNDKEVYTWSPNGRVTLDLSEMIMKERKIYTRNIAQSVKSTFKAMSSMRKIYVTGGTANLLIKDEFTRVIKIAHFVNNSETANVRGYYKYGLINEVTTVDEATR